MLSKKRTYKEKASRIENPTFRTSIMGEIAGCEMQPGLIIEKF